LIIVCKEKRTCVRVLCLCVCVRVRVNVLMRYGHEVRAVLPVAAKGAV